VSQLSLLLLVSILNVSLGALVYSRNRHHWVNRSFAFFAFSVSGWSITQASRLAGSEPALFWARVAFLMAGMSLFAMALFIETFPFHNVLPSSWPVRILGASVCALALFSLFTPWIVTSATRTAQGRRLTYGPLYDAFALYVLCCAGYCVLRLIQKARSARGAERQQLKFLFVALLVPGACAIVTNLLVPLLTGSSSLSQYGPLFSVVMIAMIAHAIIRHRMMDIRLVVRQGVVYVCAIATAAAMFFFLVEIFHRTIGGDTESIPFLEAFVFAVVVAIVFQPLKHWINESFNRYLYRHTYDYQQILREASRTLSTTLALKPLMEYLAAVVDHTLQVEFIAVYLMDQPGRKLSCQFYRAARSPKPAVPPLALSGQSDILRYLSEKRAPLVRDEAGRHSSTEIIIGAAAELTYLNAEVALPLLRDQSIAGIVILGSKRSGDPFFGQDLDLLSTLTAQAGVAMRNAQLYQQVVLANEYVENILRTMDSGVITVDSTGTVALCNSTAERLTGISKGRLVSLPVEALPASLGSQLRATLEDGHPRLQVESSLPGERDRRTPLVCSTSALRDEQGLIIGALIVFSDLSKIKALENEKRRAERLASFGALVSGIAHEIKNPLVAIKTFAELLPERFTDSDFRDDFSKVVGSEIDRIDGLVGRLRSLGAPAPETIAAIDLREPISDTLSLLRAQFEHTQTSVERDLGSSAASVAIDPGQAKQLFLNLFLNAIEAMPPGGQLIVNLARVYRQGVPWFQVAVTDTGPGIPESIRTKVFEPFFTTKTRGSGLGLAICRSIADAHRGTLRVETPSLGTGTSVVVEFPAASAEARLKQQSAMLR
jgi:signal transduction histidine kinase